VNDTMDQCRGRRKGGVGTSVDETTAGRRGMCSSAQTWKLAQNRPNQATIVWRIDKHIFTAMGSDVNDCDLDLVFPARIPDLFPSRPVSKTPSFQSNVTGRGSGRDRHLRRVCVSRGGGQVRHHPPPTAQCHFGLAVRALADPGTGHRQLQRGSYHTGGSRLATER
jgi:hypothetical protein